MLHNRKRTVQMLHPPDPHAWLMHKVVLKIGLFELTVSKS